MITVKQAALMIGASEQWVRSACERGILGDCTQNGQRRFYIVSPGRLMAWMGWTQEELKQHLGE